MNIKESYKTSFVGFLLPAFKEKPECKYHTNVALMEFTKYENLQKSWTGVQHNKTISPFRVL